MRKICEASFIINNAQDLFEVLSRFSKAHRETIDIEDYDRLELQRQTLTDESTVENLKGRWATTEQKKRETAR